MSERVSIVIPVFNAERTIVKVIEACLSQDYSKENLEIIVVDDGSTDGTKEIVKNYPLKYIYQEKSCPAKARNNGWRAATGDIVCFTDADCIPEKEWVSKLIAHYTSDKVGAVGGSYGIANEGNILADCIYQEIISRHLKMPKSVRMLGSYNLSVRREILENSGGFDESYLMASGEDNELSYKILKQGYTLVFDRDIRVFHYHPQQFLRYLRTQFWHGFWRVKLYLDHFNMVKGDDYSSFWDYIQPFIAVIVFCLAPFWFIFPVNLILLALLTVEFVLQLPMAVFIVIRTKKAKYGILVIITFLRAFARGFGLFFGLTAIFIRKKGKQAKWE